MKSAKYTLVTGGDYRDRIIGGLTKVTLVEWPERLGELVPVGALQLNFVINEGNAHLVTLVGWPEAGLAAF